ncbi:MAG TPA: hypothetical protein VIA09_01760 [Nitrososphaeraceae archaeon]
MRLIIEPSGNPWVLSLPLAKADKLYVDIFIQYSVTINLSITAPKSSLSFVSEYG